MNSAFWHSLRLKLLDYIYTPDSGESTASIRQRLEEFYSVFHVVTANIGNTSVYRVRKIEPNEEHNHFKDVWCPNPNDVKKIGRANDIGQSVFYGAFDPGTAVAETRIIPGEKYSLAVFRLKNSETHNSVVIRQAEHIMNQIRS